MIMNRMYENQNLLYIVPLMKHTIFVCISNISPMALGCFIRVLFLRSYRASWLIHIRYYTNKSTYK